MRMLLTMGLVLTTMTAAEAETWDMPTPYPDGALTTALDSKFASDINSLSHGSVDISLHSNGTLLKHADIKRAVQTGQVQIGELLISTLANEDPIFGLDAIPFLATDYDKARKLDLVSRPYLEQRLDKAGIKLLFTIPWPPQGLYTRKVVNSLADLKGVMFRTYNPTTMRLAKLIGMVPTRIEVSDMAAAFNTGRADAMMTSSATGVDTKCWEFVSQFYDIQAWLPRSMVIVNKDAFLALPADLQKGILDTAALAGEQAWAVSLKRNEEFKKILADHQIAIRQPSPELTVGLTQIGKDMTADWLKTAGPDGQSIIDAYLK